MKNRCNIVSYVGLVLFLSAFQSFAISHVVSGTIYNQQTGSTVDFWQVTLSGNGNLTIDVRAWERGSEESEVGDPGPPVDLNGDGEITQLDSYIYLFDANWTQLGSNDDSSSTFGDGSLSSLDSYLSIAGLSAGTYTLALGQFYLSSSEASAGFNPGDFTPGTHGDYQITFNWSGDGLTVRSPSTSVPEAGSTLVLLGLGMLGMVALNRVRRK
jgi:hypothetical protein